MKSMTGFGRGEATVGALVFRAEVASVNRKQADVVVSLPRDLSELETQVRELVAGSVSRGRVTVNISVAAGEGGASKLRIDEALAGQYLAALESLASQFDRPELPNSFDPLRAPGVVSLGEVLPEPEDAWPAISQALTTALAAVVEMRNAEGTHLQEDLLAKLAQLQQHVSDIEGRAPAVRERYRENLHKRLVSAGLDIDLDDERVLREIGLFAERCDISEEITRLESHFVQCTKYFGSDEPAGRSLDFLAQEMNRELNTIGSKANDAGIAQRVVEAKAELEKIREQVQNVE